MFPTVCELVPFGIELNRRMRKRNPKRPNQLAVCGEVTEQGYMSEERVLHGLPHPSTANAERVAYFLGEKVRADLSIKTSANNLDAARDNLLKSVAGLR